MVKPKLLRKDLTTEKAFPSGAWIVQALVWDRQGQHLAVRSYYGMTKRQAQNAFLQEFRNG